MDARGAAPRRGTLGGNRADFGPRRAYAAGAVPIIIDTYNALHVTGVLPPELAVGEPEALAQLIAASRFGSEAVWLICDGVPRGASRVGRIVIEGAGPGKSADDHIAAFLDRSSAPRRLTVVTSDRAIQRKARSRGAEWVKSEDFLAMLADDARRKKPAKPAARKPDPRRSVPLNGREVAGWMTLFEISAEQSAIQAAPSLPKQPSTSTRAPSRPRSDDAALERYLLATKDLADPLSILDRKEGSHLLEALGELDDDAIERLMKEHEPPVLKDGARIGGRKRVKDARRGDGRKRDKP